ncbi:xanthine phosphoribosyltransferase [Faecalicatena contorta]|uniref:xanthine phosphoribosyltransferase n=1 Tax=Faecalicatena contorta TaxID=39482 RepID=UPI001F28787A|nr:xanthine phosphoribosyltransferase [Faecalicatena contorta]MCF2554218.1 xanthine phosphoribosyltransferase [Faecalicatena contorta]
MELLKERIRKDGIIKPGNVLKVDSFLNHQMDIQLFNEIGKEFKRRFADVKVDRILTIEASGIGIAAIVAQYFDCPVVFAKKTQSINLDGTMLSTQIESFTHKRTYEVIVASRFIKPGENVLVIDDFMANGCAALGLIDLIKSAHANVVGVGIVIEKGFQQGGAMLREQGLRVESLAIVDDMDADTQSITFRES